jgi:hypothetical protein
MEFDATMPLDFPSEEVEHATYRAIGSRMVRMQYERAVNPNRVDHGVFRSTDQALKNRPAYVTEYVVNAVYLGSLFAKVESTGLECEAGFAKNRAALEAEIQLCCQAVEAICVDYFEFFKMKACEETGGLALPRLIWPLGTDGRVSEPWASLGA